MDYEGPWTKGVYETLDDAKDAIDTKPDNDFYYSIDTWVINGNMYCRTFYKNGSWITVDKWPYNFPQAN